MAIIKADSIVDHYSLTLPNAATTGETYKGWLLGGLAQQKLPVQGSKEQASTGIFGALTGSGRDVIIVRPTNKGLKDYRMLHFAVPSGQNLSLGWLLCGPNPRVGERFSRLPDLDVFDALDLNAILDGIHQFAVVPAINALAKQIGYPPADITKRTTTFLGIS